MTKKRRIWFSVLGVLVVLFIVFLIVGKDGPAPEVSDLTVVSRKIPDAENGLALLLNNWGMFAPHPPTPLSELVSLCVVEEDWAISDSNRMDAVLTASVEPFERIRSALACEDFQLHDRHLSDTGKFRHILRILMIRSTWQFRSGQHEATMDTCFQMIKLGHVLQGSGGGSMAVLTGSSVKDYGLGQIEWMLPGLEMTPDRLRHYAKRLSDYTSSTERLQQSQREEYSYYGEAIDRYESGDEDLRMLLEYPPYIWGGFYFWQPNNTKAQLSNAYRRMIDNLGRRYSDVDIGYRDAAAEPSFSQWLRPNSLGRQMNEIFKPPLRRKFLRIRHRQDFDTSAVQLLLVLKAYEAERGALPETLQELVPEYIDRISTDPFDGNPIRYSRERRVIYSVGADLTDSGGSTNALEGVDDVHSRWQTDDAVYELR